VARKSTKRFMWRITVSAPYYYRYPGKKRESISSAFMVRSWFKSKAEAESPEVEEELTDQALEGRNQTLAEDRLSWWNNDPTYVEVTKAQKVPYDAKFIGVTSERDERE
jgi:hypothetical protein